MRQQMQEQRQGAAAAPAVAQPGDLWSKRSPSITTPVGYLLQVDKGTIDMRRLVDGIGIGRDTFKTCKEGNNYNKDSSEMIEISDMVLFLFYLVLTVFNPVFKNDRNRLKH